MRSEPIIVYEPAEEVGSTATVPAVPGAICEGQTMKEAKEMGLDAVSEPMAHRGSRG